MADRNQQARQKHVQTSIGRAFQNHDTELGVKVATTLRLWYEAIDAERLQPLERRVKLLETVLGIRALRWVAGLPGRLVSVVLARRARADEPVQPVVQPSE